MALIDDLLIIGLPAALENGEIVFSRKLSGAENNLYRALLIKYMPDTERTQILAKRKDLSNLLDKISTDIDVEPIRLEIRNEYINAVTTLTQIQDTATLTNTQAVSAIKYIAKVLLIILRFLASRYKAKE